MALARAVLRWNESNRLTPSPARFPRALPKSMQSLHVIAREVEFTWFGDYSVDRRAGSINELADLMQPPALFPALPHQRLLGI